MTALGCALAAAVCCDSASISAGKMSSVEAELCVVAPEGGGEWSWIQLTSGGNGFKLLQGRFRWIFEWILGLKMVKFGGGKDLKSTQKSTSGS